MASFALIAPVHVATQGVSIRAETLKDWTELRSWMDKMANAMPEDKFAFKPVASNRSFGQQIMRLALDNVQYLGAIDGKTPAPVIDGNATGKVAIIKAMDDSFDYGMAILNQQTDQTMMQVAANPPAILGPSTRVRVFSMLMAHVSDVYGHMAVYLALNDIAAPAKANLGWGPPLAPRPGQP
jgi:hypothetical protein